MNGFTLTPQEEMILRMAHKSIQDKRYVYRINAVILLGTGWSYDEAAEALLLDEATLRNYVKIYQEGGVEALSANNYKGSSAKLSTEQRIEFDTHLQENTYLTVDAIIAYVVKTYGVLYSISGMTDLLHRLNFTYKKSKLIPAKADAKNQEKFLDDLQVIEKTRVKTIPFYIWMAYIHSIIRCLPMVGLRKAKTIS